MRILFINQTYAPDVAASAQLLEAMARQFADHGHEVAVITSRSLYGKAGTALPRYEDLHGVHVHRVGISRFGNNTLPARIIDATLFYLSATFKSLRVKLPGGPPQVVITLTSPPYIGFIGAFSRMLRGGRRKGRHYVNWTMDMYPDVLTAAGIVKRESIVGRVMHRLNHWSLKLADKVVVVGRCMRDRMISQGIDPKKIELISVWPVSRVLDTEEADQPSSYRESWGLEGKFVVMYSGNLGIAHEAATLAEAARRLEHRDDIRFVFVGGGKKRPEISKHIAWYNLTNVIEKGYEPHDKLEDLLKLGDVHLISQREEFTGVVVPCKLFGIMASCRPSLYVGPAEAEVARVLTESQSGEIFNIGEVDKLVAAIERLADHPDLARQMGQNAHEALIQSHTLEERFDKAQRMVESLGQAEAEATAASPQTSSPAAPDAAASAAPALSTTASTDTPDQPPAELPRSRVVFINQAYAPDAAATAQHCEDLARYLVGQGHGVSVIASRSIYGQAGAALPKRENRHGVNVQRVGLSLFGKRGILLRSLDFALFYLSAMWRALWIKVPIDGKHQKPDVVVTLTTPPFIGVVGGMMHRLRRCQQVYWAMDLYPDVLVAADVSNENSLITRLLERLNRREMRKAERVVALGRCMKNLIESKDISPDHIDVIGVWSPNTPDETVPDPAASSYRKEWSLEDKFVVQYSGNFGLAHDYKTFCNAMLQLREHQNIVFLFAGGGKRGADVRAFAKEHGLTNVMFQPYQPRERLPDLLQLADVHLISQSAAFTGIVVPSKLFGIMAAGRASLFVGPEDAEVGQVLSETGAGLRFNIDDADALANAILGLARDPARVQRMSQAALDAAAGPHHQTNRFKAWERLIMQVNPRSAAAYAVQAKATTNTA